MQLASAINAPILGFNVREPNKIARLGKSKAFNYTTKCNLSLLDK